VSDANQSRPRVIGSRRSAARWLATIASTWRHHRQGRRHLQRRCADHRSALIAVLRSGAAGQIAMMVSSSRHRRRLTRARPRRAACASGRRARASASLPVCLCLAERSRRSPRHLVRGLLSPTLSAARMSARLKAAERAIAHVASRLSRLTPAADASFALLRLDVVCGQGRTTEPRLRSGDARRGLGGACPLHAVHVAREIGILTVIIPARPCFLGLRTCFLGSAATISCPSQGASGSTSLSTISDHLLSSSNRWTQRRSHRR